MPRTAAGEGTGGDTRRRTRRASASAARGARPARATESRRAARSPQATASPCCRRWRPSENYLLESYVNEILLVDGDRLWVGFSRMRATRFRDNVAWVKNGFRRWLGTHVACYDLRERRCIAQIGTEEAGLDAVFGIHAAR